MLKYLPVAFLWVPRIYFSIGCLHIRAPRHPWSTRHRFHCDSHCGVFLWQEASWETLSLTTPTCLGVQPCWLWLWAVVPHGPLFITRQLHYWLCGCRSPALIAAPTQVHVGGWKFFYKRSFHCTSLLQHLVPVTYWSGLNSKATSHLGSPHFSKVCVCDSLHSLYVPGSLEFVGCFFPGIPYQVFCPKAQEFL